MVQQVHDGRLPTGAGEQQQQVQGMVGGERNGALRERKGKAIHLAGHRLLLFDAVPERFESGALVQRRALNVLVEEGRARRLLGTK